MLDFLFSRIPEEPVRRKVLLVDDDRDIRTVTSMVLATRGVGAVHEAATGREGLELARSQQPDLILLDIALPDISGETVVQLLRVDPLTRDIPIVFFTASLDGLRRMQELRVAAVVLKPFDPQQLCSLLERVMRTPRPQPQVHRAPAALNLKTAIAPSQA